MTKRIFFFIFSFICVALNIQSQTIIEGIVLDAQGKPVDAFVTVSLKSSSNILSFADTDANGKYKLEFESAEDSVIIAAAGLGVSNYVKIVKNCSQRIDFLVERQTTELEEVSVRAQKIMQHGDTLSYLVGAYRQQGDRVIGDVLKRMPGIEVAENGGIKFNGKSISKFYVEDMDLLQGRYGLATNNINVQDVVAVEILENHQPVKALQGKTLTDDVAVNLKLRNAAKGSVAINTMLGGGFQQSQTIGSNPLWNAEVVGMYFAKQRQNMTLYKCNNTGEDVSKELTQHYSSINSVSLYPFCPMGVIMPSGSGLPQKRTYDNQSHILTTNHLEKIFKDTEIGLNIAYYNDCIRREGNSENNQFVNDDSRLHTRETLTSETMMNNLSIQGRYNWNSFNGFLANVLKFDANWNRDQVNGLLASESIGNMPMNYGTNRIRQNFDCPQLSISNTFNTIRNFGRHTLDLHFSAGYSQRPNTLTVGIDTLLQRTSTTYSQDIMSHHIAGNFHTNFNYRLGLFTLCYGIMADASLHGIETNLNGFNTGIYSPRNNLWYNTYEIVFGQYYKFEKRGWILSLGCPLNLYTQTLDDRVRDDNHNYVHFLVTPTFSATYAWSDWSANINTNYSKNVGDPGGIYSGYIMNNYRSFQRSFVEQLSETDCIRTGGTIGYRNALTASFFRINGSYSHTCNNQIYGTIYQGATSVVQAVDKRTESDNYSVGISGSKGFDWLQSTISAFGGYSYSTNERLIESTIYPFHMQSVSVGGGGTITPLPWINFVLSSGYSWSISQTNSSSDKLARIVKSATQRLKVNVYVTKQLTFVATAEDNFNNLTDVNRHVWFGDVAAKYKMKHVDIELQLNNLFDQRQYTRVYYSGLDIYTQTSQLRPRNAILTVRFKLL